MNKDHVHTATVKIKTANISFASFFAKPPNQIPANISGYTVFILCTSLGSESFEGVSYLKAHTILLGLSGTCTLHLREESISSFLFEKLRPQVFVGERGPCTRPIVDLVCKVHKGS